MIRTTAFSVSGQLAQPEVRWAAHHAWALAWKAWEPSSRAIKRLTSSKERISKALLVHQALHVLQRHHFIRSRREDGDAVAGFRREGSGGEARGKQSLSSESRDDRTRRGFLFCGKFLRGLEDVIRDVQCGSHASDVSASNAGSQAASPERRQQRGQRAFIRRVGEEGVGELAFLGLELVDAFLDGALADELVDEDRLRLADAVGAVGVRIYSAVGSETPSR
jgi:hypothetical protein